MDHFGAGSIASLNAQAGSEPVSEGAREWVFEPLLTSVLIPALQHCRLGAELPYVDYSLDRVGGCLYEPDRPHRRAAGEARVPGCRGLGLLLRRWLLR